MAENEHTDSPLEGLIGRPIGYDDATWILTSAFIIFTMQSGFGLIESGKFAIERKQSLLWYHLYFIWPSSQQRWTVRETPKCIFCLKKSLPKDFSSTYTVSVGLASIFKSWLSILEPKWQKKKALWHKRVQQKRLAMADGQKYAVNIPLLFIQEHFKNRFLYKGKFSKNKKNKRSHQTLLTSFVSSRHFGQCCITRYTGNKSKNNYRRGWQRGV